MKINYEVNYNTAEIHILFVKETSFNPRWLFLARQMETSIIFRDASSFPCFLIQKRLRRQRHALFLEALL